MKWYCRISPLVDSCVFGVGWAVPTFDSLIQRYLVGTAHPSMRVVNYFLYFFKFAVPFGHTPPVVQGRTQDPKGHLMPLNLTFLWTLNSFSLAVHRLSEFYQYKITALTPRAFKGNVLHSFQSDTPGLTLYYRQRLLVYFAKLNSFWPIRWSVLDAYAWTTFYPWHSYLL